MQSQDKCKGGTCDCGDPGVHVRLRSGQVSCGYCLACLRKMHDPLDRPVETDGHGTVIT